MTLPSSGEISINDINAELGLSATAANSSLTARSTTAGFSTPDSMAEFHGFSYIPISFGTITDTKRSSTYIDAYRTIQHTNHPSGTVLRFDVNYDGNCGSSASVWLYYRINGGSWQTIDYISGAGNMSGTEVITLVDYNDVIEINIDMYNSGSYADANFNVTGDGALVTAGNARTYRTGTTDWSETL